MKKNLILSLALMLSSVTFAQVGIGTTTPDSSAILDLTSTTKGFLPPRLSTAERIAIASPAVGLTIYNTTRNCIEWYNGSVWLNGCGIQDSSNGTAVVSNYSCSTGSAGTMTVGTPIVSGVVTQTITATVTTAGTYKISAIANGVTFSGSNTFTGTGAQDIVLTATGTPTAGTDQFILNTTPNCNFNRSLP